MCHLRCFVDQLESDFVGIAASHVESEGCVVVMMYVENSVSLCIIVLLVLLVV